MSVVVLREIASKGCEASFWGGLALANTLEYYGREERGADTKFGKENRKLFLFFENREWGGMSLSFLSAGKLCVVFPIVWSRQVHACLPRTFEFLQAYNF